MILPKGSNPAQIIDRSGNVLGLRHSERKLLSYLCTWLKIIDDTKDNEADWHECGFIYRNVLLHGQDTWLDHGCGLRPREIRRAAQSLVNQGLLIWRYENYRYNFTIQFDKIIQMMREACVSSDDTPEIIDHGCPPNRPPVTGELTTGDRIIDHRCPPNRPPVTGELTTGDRIIDHGCPPKVRKVNNAVKNELIKKPRKQLITTVINCSRGLLDNKSAASAADTPDKSGVKKISFSGSSMDIAKKDQQHSVDQHSVQEVAPSSILDNTSSNDVQHSIPSRDAMLASFRKKYKTGKPIIIPDPQDDDVVLIDGVAVSA